MNISRLSIKNFKSIKEMDLDFSYLRGLWEISGDVGSGKTSIGEALLYGLFGSVKDKNNRDLIKWGEKHAVVEITCFSKGYNLRIVREINSSGSNPTTVYVNNELQQFSNKRDAQSILENEYYDVPRLSLELLCIITFSGFKSISTLSPSDTRKFLDQIFSLSIITDLNTIANSKKAETGDVINGINRDKYALEKQIDNLSRFLNTDSDELKSNITSYGIIKNKLEEEISVLKKERDEKLSNIKTQLLDSRERLGKIKNDGVRKKKEIEYLKNDICPICGAKIDSSLLTKYKEERDILLEEYNKENNNLNKYTEEYNKENSNYNITISAKELELQNVNSEIVKCNENLKMSIKCNTDIERLKKELDELNNKETLENVEYSQWSNLCLILSNDMRSFIIREYIPHINNYINSFMTSLEQPYSVNIDENFKCSVFIPSKQIDVPINMLSTGQKKVLDLVIILSIVSVLINKINFNICFADELLSNMDKDLRDKMTILLKNNMREGQSMFLLSHAPLDQNILDGVLNIKLVEGESVLYF